MGKYGWTSSSVASIKEKCFPSERLRTVMMLQYTSYFRLNTQLKPEERIFRLLRHDGVGLSDLVDYI